MKSFWNISNKWNQMLIAFEESGGEVTDELAELLSVNRQELDEIIDEQLTVKTLLEEDNERIAKQIEKLKSKKELNLQMIGNIKSSLVKAIKSYGELGRLKTPLYNLSIKKTSVVDIEDMSQIPNDYKQYKLKTSLTADVKKNLMRILSRFDMEFEETVDKNRMKSDVEKGNLIEFGFKLKENENPVIR